MKALLAAIVFALPLAAFSDDKSADRRLSHITADTLVAFRSDDFRRAFCDYQTLQSRIERHLAFIYDLFDTRTSEVHLEEHATVGEIMQKAGLKFRGRSSPIQYRLITKDAIYQSPTRVDKSLEEAFAGREIQAGDILILTVVD
jgi:hypothetical protein